MTSHRDPRFAAVLVVACEAFPLDNRVWRHINEVREEVDFDRVLSDASFTSTERLLLEIAASLWTSSSHPTILGVIADRLGDEWLAVVLRALAVSRGADLTSSGRAPRHP